jgi:hypothetical protein
MMRSLTKMKRFFQAGGRTVGSSQLLITNRSPYCRIWRRCDNRQSRRLVGGLAAQSRMALRAVSPRRPCCQRLGLSFTPCPAQCQPVRDYSTPRGNQPVCALQRAVIRVACLSYSKITAIAPPRHSRNCQTLGVSPAKPGAYQDLVKILPVLAGVYEGLAEEEVSRLINVKLPER